MGAKTNLPGVKIVIGEDGYHFVCGVVSIVGTGTAVISQAKLRINGNTILHTGGQVYHNSSNAGYNIIAQVPISSILYLKSGDIITIEVEATSGTVLALPSGTSDATYIEAVNLTKLSRGGL